MPADAADALWTTILGPEGPEATRKHLADPAAADPHAGAAWALAQRLDLS